MSVQWPSMVSFFAVGNEELRIPIRALAGQHDPAVEAGGIAAEVPFADHAGVVAAFLQVLGHVVAAAVEAVENRHAIQVRILPGEQRGAAGGADGVGDEAVGEARATFGEAVNVRGLVDLGAVGGDGVLGVVVGEDEQDIRRRGLGDGGGQKGGGEREESEHDSRGERQRSAVLSVRRWEFDPSWASGRW
jgi:hypothetical protein